MKVKKICLVLILVFVVVLISTILIKKYKVCKTVKINNKNISVVDSNIVDETLNENIITTEPPVEQNILEPQVTTENTHEIIPSTTNEESKNVKTSTDKVSQEVRVDTNAIIKENNIVETNNSSTIVDENETIPEISTQPKEETIPEITKDEGPKYVKNDTMINTITQTIKNNETEDMRNFGYNIVVDSSIKSLTNQFTFTENRVINAIRYKFGTIRIYVEDYYYNGQFIMTQCYIL